jgi:uncharacterized membrane protein (DUF106 family)
MDSIARIIAWLNSGMNFLARPLQYIIPPMPGWLSLTVISAVVGVLLLIVFKYTSNQKAIARTRDNIKAQLLAMKLFKDFIPVVLKSQAKIIANAFLLLFYALRPTLVMIIPFSLILGQLGLWYQAHPLNVGEETVMTMHLSESNMDDWPQVELAPSEAVHVTVGPVKVVSKRQMYWKFQALDEGYHQLKFRVDNQSIEKEIAVGNRFMRVSGMRPDLDITNLIMYPYEKPFSNASPVQSIRIDYPDRPSKISGTDWWVIYLFITSIIFALIFKPILKVKF